MTDQPTHPLLGRRVFGLGVIALGVVALASGDFLLGQPVPKSFPGRTVLAYAAGVFILAAGVAIEWRRTVVVAAAALTAYYALIVVALMNGRVVLRNPAVFGAYSGTAEELAVAAGALIVYASHAALRDDVATRLVSVGRRLFGVCAVLFGGAHFFYMSLTIPFVPTWIPPSQAFWGYATGVAHILGGIAIVTGVKARLAAILLTVMYASFAVLVHAPMLIGEPASRMNWNENAVNLALTGVAWVVADSLMRRRPRHGR